MDIPSVDCIGCGLPQEAAAPKLLEILDSEVENTDQYSENLHSQENIQEIEMKSKSSINQASTIKVVEEIIIEDID